MPYNDTTWVVMDFGAVVSIISFMIEPCASAPQQKQCGAPNNDCFFDVILKPNTSLGSRGFWLLMIGISVFGLIAGVGFVAVGAWPVLGFFGLDILLIYLGFKINYRRARRYERISLGKRVLVVDQVSASGRINRWQVEPSWLRVQVTSASKHDRQLILSSHGQSVNIGSFLAPDERSELASVLKKALKFRATPKHLLKQY